MCHIAERAATGTDSAEDHEGRGAVVKAFSQIRARSFFTHRVQTVVAHGRFDFLDPGGISGQLDFHPLGLTQALTLFSGNVFHRNQCHFIGIAVFHAPFNLNRFTHWSVVSN